MKKKLFFLLTIILSLNSYSQVSFEKGYYIDNNDQKISCLIKNLDWKNNPTKFEFKLSENSETQKADIKSIKEFAITNATKFIRSTVKIDRSSGNVNNLNADKNPVFSEEQLFLKVLVEGKANLYEYTDSDLKRYFYNKTDAPIEQLIYKSYMISDLDIGKNTKFRQQLWMDLNCPNFKLSDVEKVEYKKNDLVQYFTKYSSCLTNESVEYTPKQKKDLFNLTIRSRLYNSSLAIKNSMYNLRNTDFGKKTRIGFGVEAEYILPFNKNKWSIAIEPSYQSFKSEKTTNVKDVSGGIQNVSIDYSSIEVPLTIRHYFFLNKNAKLFVNASYVIDFALKSSVEFTRNDDSNFNTLEIKSRNNPAIGIGFKQNDRYSIELRYQTSSEILANYVFWSSNYKTVAIIFGYSFF